MNEINYNGTPYRTHGDLPAVGSRAPDISLVNTSLQAMSLANFMGMRKILNICPSIDRPVCERAAIVFNRLANLADDVATLVVSYDLPFAHARMQEAKGLQDIVGLSAIRHEGFGENYGVQIEEGPLKGMFAPAVVVLDENNTVVHTEQLADIGDEPDYLAAYRALGVDVDPDLIED